MKNWQKDFLGSVGNFCSAHDAFAKIIKAAESLGFEHCAYGLRIPLPFSNPKTVIINTYPVAWQKRYAEAEYLSIDPTVAHGCRSQNPLVWSDNVFDSAPALWEEARSFGLCVGWAQSSLNTSGVRGMLSLSRSHDPLGDAELDEHESDMRWLAILAHSTLSPFFTAKLESQFHCRLTVREIEILKWTADGKTSGDISAILAVSENTVNFHIKNIVQKMNVANKTAAVVRAAVLGLLY